MWWANYKNACDLIIYVCVRLYVCIDYLISLDLFSDINY